MTQDTNDYYYDEDGTSEFNDAIETELNIASTKIIKSHRDTQINFETDLRLDFNLTHTIELDTNILDAKGKVTSIYHSIYIDGKRGDTTTEINLSTIQGSQVSDSLTAPSRPSVSVVADSFNDPQIMVLDLYNTGDIITPDIEDISRGEQTATQTAAYNVGIQNDTFGVTF